MCYANDTLVLAAEDDWGNALNNACCATERVVGSVTDLGLEVSLRKSECVFFHNGRRGRFLPFWILIGTVCIRVTPTIKYLGLILDGRWDFASLASRVGKMADALTLMPNLGGSGDSVRRMYAGAVMSCIMYGAPVWAGEAEGNTKARKALYMV